MKHRNTIKSLITVVVILVHAAAQAQELRIGQGTSLVADGEVKIVLSGASFVNNGNFKAGGSTLLMTANTSKQLTFIGGKSRTQFHHLSIDLPSNLVQLENDISVSGLLTMNAGNLELNNRRLDLGSTGIIMGEHIHSRIIGEKGGLVMAQAVLDAPARINPGNLGLELSSKENLGSTVITRGHVQQVNTRGMTGIQRYFEIEPAYKQATVSLRFFYLQPEVGEISKSELVLWSHDRSTGWIAIAPEGNQSSANWIAKGDLRQLKRITLGIAEKGGAEKAGLNSTAEERTTMLSVQAFPNPAKDRLSVALYSDAERVGGARLQDQFGQVLERRQQLYIHGLNVTKWNIARYAAGTYYIVFEGIAVEPVKFVKQ